MEQGIFPGRARTGQAFLSMVFFIGGIMVLVGITMVVIAATFVDAGYGIQASNSAEAAATAGAEDAYLQLIRNSAFQNTSGYAVSNTGTTSATVTVAQGSPSAGYATAVSLATVGGRTRKVQVVFAVNAGTGQVAVVSWADVL
jgi:hypothetical protein